MKIIGLTYIVFFTTISTLTAQNKKSTFQSREVIMHSADTFIKARIITDEIKILPAKNKKYYWYWKGTINSNFGGNAGKLLHNEYKAFLDNRLIESGQFDRGLKIGEWILWYPSGMIKKICNYKEGILDGKYIQYKEDATVEIGGFYRKRKFHLKKRIK